MSCQHLYLLPLCCLTFLCPYFLLGQAVDSLESPPPLPLEETEMFITWERMPTLRSCDSLDIHAARSQCTEKIIRRILAENLRWPAEVCGQGMVVVSFVVEDDGRLNDFKIARSIPPFDEEALRVVKLLAAQTGPWHPATFGRKQKPVRTIYNLPVKFKLE